LRLSRRDSIPQYLFVSNRPPSAREAPGPPGGPARPGPARGEPAESVERACTLALKIIPNAPRNEIVGWLGPALKVKVHAPALEGRANDELLAFLAEILGVPRRSVTLLRGDKSRQKLVQISGLDLVGAKTRLGLK